MSLGPYDQQRFEQEWAADQDVIKRLSEQGDRVDQPRNFDVSFRGPRENLLEAEEKVRILGFETIGLIALDSDEWRLDICRLQAATPDAIRQMTILALQIEAACDVVYDGWGCIAQNDRA